MSVRPPKPLTDHQRKVLDYLNRHRRVHGLIPSTREIQQALGFSSQTAVVRILGALERRGAIRRAPGKARGVVLLSERGGGAIIDLPIMGAIPAGPPDAMEEPVGEGTLTIDRSLFGLSASGRFFALRVRGDSMTGVHIQDGDVVVLESSDTRSVRANEIVAALIDGETTLKRYLVKDGQSFLRAENPAYPDLIPARELRIQGVYRGLVRR